MPWHGLPQKDAPGARLSHTGGCGCLDRRALLLGAGALGFGLSAAAYGRGPLAASALVPEFGPPPANIRAGRRIDVHHHAVPPAYLAVASNGNSPQVKGWSISKTLDDMAAGGIATAVLSLPSFGLWSGDIAADRRTARACNEFLAQLARDHPGRFGVFATLPLRDIEGSLAEAAYSLDVLKADGVGLFTSYHDRWLGDPAFDPVFDELNRRRALVYTHPTVADCCAHILPVLSPSAIEYGTDTTRAIFNWVLGGSGSRFPDLKLIFSHAGGTMPFLIQRLVQEARTPAHDASLSDRVLPLLRSYYYDTAQAANPVALGALTKIVSPSQVLFGTDFPYRTGIETVAGIGGSQFTAKEIAMIDHGNALRLLPRLAMAGAR